MKPFHLILLLAITLFSPIGSYLSAQESNEPTRIPLGKIKYAMKVSELTVSIGDRIDIFAIVKTPDGEVKDEILLRNVLVLTIDTTSSPRGGGESKGCTVSVAVIPKDALMLNAAEKRGPVRLSRTRLD